MRRKALHENPVFRAAMVSGGGADGQIRDGVAGEVLQDLSTSDPKMAKASEGNFATGVDKLFGSKFKCIDDEAKLINPGSRGSGGDLCKALHQENADHQTRMDKLKDLESQALACQAEERKEPVLTSLIDSVKQIQIEMNDNDGEEQRASIARGRHLVQDKDGRAHCIRCHGATPDNDGQPKTFLFVPAEAAGKEKYGEQMAVLKSRIREGFLDEINDKLFGGEMPADGELNETERRDVYNYLRSLVATPAPAPEK